MGTEAAKLTVGFHEFFRYTIPGYAFLIVIFLLFIAFGETRFFQNLPQTVISILAGPPIGFLIHWIYYSIFSCWYTRRSKAYTKIGEEIEKYTGNHEELKEEFTKRKILVIRCLWDNVFFSKKNEMRDRIEFLFTTFHSIGSVLLALWLGFFTGIYVLSFLNQKIKVPAQFSIFLLISPPFAVLWAVIFISIFLVISYKSRYDLGTSLEHSLVLKLKDLLTEEIESFANALSESKK